MAKKVYISGPITADPDHYKEHFAEMEKYLIGQGFEVINPSKDEYDDEVAKNHNNKWTKEAWVDYIKRDIDIVSNCDVICLLQGWEKSLGALVELATAKRFGLKVMVECENGYGEPDAWIRDEWSIEGLRLNMSKAHFWEEDLK